MSIRALVVAEQGGRASGSVADAPDPVPGDGEALLDVWFSSLNFKDAMAVAGRPGILRGLPKTAGIDAVGVLPGGRTVVVTGAGLGERRDGGLAQRVAIDPTWAVEVPSPFTPAHAAAIGTAGVTAALSVLRLQQLAPPAGPVLVTGAGGGVGGFAVALLAASGFEVIASTGRVDELGEHLRALGAAEVVPRLEAEPGRPLQSQRWSGVVDSVGGGSLANAIAQTAPGGVVTACGLAASPDLPATVLPFILRGVVLAGIDSVGISPETRRTAWTLLADRCPIGVVERMTERIIGLDEVPAAAEDVLAGQVRGRVVVDVRR
ncbi:MAG TPA: acryloyl-CoA reductase [Amnibacterium sp.]|uniref:acrylyl-CoA reductase family protein n=1 Tax=Amnibacterium sp. TaxID=1872496 RepID=UPI002F939211